jgi:sugar lactone lactonase YvrE
MKLNRLPLAVALIASAITLTSMHVAAKEGGLTAGTVIAHGINNSTGATVGPDGALYVVDGGHGGDMKVTTPDGDGYFGLTGSVVRVDPATGAVTTYKTGFPSGAEAPGEAGFGLADVTFLGGKAYALLTGGFNYIEGLEAYPNGIYTINDDGSLKVVADISKFNDDNPVTFPDAGPGGNPFGITTRDGDFYVTDGNYNRVLKITPDGDISILASFDNVVTTGITTRSSGPLFITEFGGFPFDPSSGKVIQVGLPTGTEVEIASGYSHLISVAFGPDGKLYALSMGDQADPESGDEAVPFTGKILRVNGDGTLTPIVDGLMLATSLDFSGDTAYVTSLIGDVYQITGFSALAPLPAAEPTAAPTQPAPAPTAAPTRPGGIAAPDTGSGGMESAAAGDAWPGLLALAAAAVLLGAGAKVMRRAR